MRLELSEEDLAIQSWARNFAEQVLAPEVESHQKQKISLELLSKLSAEKFHVCLVPESQGGLGLTSSQFALVIQELAKVCASTSITMAVTNMIADVLRRLANESIQKRYLGQLVSGESPTASFCLTENAAGSDAGSLTTRAIKKANHYVLTGEKIYVTNGAFSKFFLVMARTSEEGNRGITAFMVDRDQKGVFIGKEEDKMGLQASSTLRMAFEEVEVPEDRMVWGLGQGFKIAMMALDGGRISVASQALGCAQASLVAGIRDAKEREQFGKPIADFQAIQWKLANAATDLSAAELLIRKAAYLKDSGQPVTLAASMAKVFATESAIRVCNEMIQIFGGYGYIKEYPVERYYRDVRVTALYEGTSEIQRVVISRELLKDK
jgi:alkylation response protein AidB-like acyl-CoA dehydrogenase